jgi:hypothetical protein
MMSAENGYLPEGATIATLEMLRKANVAFRTLPRLSEQLGQRIAVKIRAIRRAVYMEFLPTLPAESRDWPEKGHERGMAYEKWLAAQTPEFRAERQAMALQIAYRVIAAGLVEPAVTADTAQDFASDADWLANEILVFSGILDAPKPAPVETAAA